MILLVPIEMKILMHRHRQITARGTYDTYVSGWMNPEGGSDFALVQIQGQPPVCSCTHPIYPTFDGMREKQIYAKGMRSFDFSLLPLSLLNEIR